MLIQIKHFSDSQLFKILQTYQISSNKFSLMYCLGKAT